MDVVSREQEQSLEFVESQEDYDQDSLIYGYFSHCNLLSKNIISEQRSLDKFLGNKWKDLDCSKKEALLDLLFVEDDARQQFTNLNLSHTDENVIQESFPRLYIHSGQKINVDFENDLWTWRDEHSGPFSWMSRSQQDLTLSDLDPQNISKPQPKTLRVDTENPENLKKAENQFEYPANCWSRDIIDSYTQAEKSISISPCASLDFSASRTGQNREEVNEGFDESNEENITSPHPVQGNNHEDKEEPGDLSTDCNIVRKSSGKERRKRSPSPKKILRSSSLRRSPSKTSSDHGEQQLISNETEYDQYEEENSFSNPLVETQWSNFVGENDKTERPDDSSKDVSVSNIPTTQIMDRGDDMPASSPYQVQKDNVHLITPNESPAQRGKIYAVTNDLSGWSAESTPDHTTHLLKGMQNDGGSKWEPSYQEKTSSVLEKYEEEEVMTVEHKGSEFSVTTESASKRDSNIPTTGFDFLDNW